MADAESAKREERKRTEYRFLVLELGRNQHGGAIERELNRLYRDQGWEVVSQSTVFLSEDHRDMRDVKRKEGIAFTLKREI